MGFLSKVFKGVKKVVKKIGRGIKKIGRGLKKVIGKIAKPFQKFGIIGQIGLAMFLPWAAGSIWQGLTGTAFNLGNFGTVAGELAKSSNVFAKVAGYTMKGVHYGATQVSNAYQFITDKISEGFNYLTEKSQEMFGPKADASDLIQDAVQNGPEVDLTKVTEATIPDVETGVPSRITTEERLKAAATSASPTSIEPPDLLKQGTAKKPDTIFGRATEKFIDTVKTIPEKAADRTGQMLMTSLGLGDQTQVSDDHLGGAISYDVPQFIGNQSYGRYDNVDLMAQNKGFYYGGASYQANIQQSGFGQDAFFGWFNQYGPLKG